MEDSKLLEWISTEVSAYMRKYGIPDFVEKDDLISEGWLVASMAMKSYDESKKANMKTFIQVCVKNRIHNICKYEKRRVHEEFSEVVSEPFYSYIDLCLDFTNELDTRGIEIVQDLANGIGRKEFYKKERKCLVHTLQTLKQIVSTQATAETSREKQRRSKLSLKEWRIRSS